MTAESGKGQPQLWVVLSTLLMPCPVCAGECQCGRSDEAIRPAAGESVSVLKAQPAAVALAMREPRIAEAPEWKREVASRVTRYRSRRRPRGEHKRSIGFNFDAVSEAANLEAVTLTPNSSSVAVAAKVEAAAAAAGTDKQETQEIATIPPALPPTTEYLLDVHVDLYGLQRQWPAARVPMQIPHWRIVVAQRAAAQAMPAPAAASELLAPAPALLEKVAAFNGDTLLRLTETVRAMETKNYAGVRELETKVIEFPGPAEIQPELAEPVVTAPRIFEAEDVEQATREQESHENSVPTAPVATCMLDSSFIAGREQNFELPLPIAPMTLRAFGLGIDLLVVGAACVLFGLTLFEMHALPQGGSARGTSVLVAVILWCAYQALFLLRQGCTLGMRSAGLELVDVENQPPNKRQLRTRVWGVALSSAALGLGFAWALLDEDRLSWHDRISRSCTTIAKR